MIVMLQAGGAVPASTLELVTNSGPETKVVLAILVVLSLVSWAIMVGVGRELSRALKLASGFAREVQNASRFEAAAHAARHASPNAAQRLFQRAQQFVAEGSAPREGNDPHAREPVSFASASRVETLRLVLDAEALAERDRLGRFLPWLATIGSASPLIGLLGTVLGVMSAFVGIATKGSGNLAAVAPGVAEALIATAAALTVAIPATFGYNILANRLNRLDNLLEGFGTTVIAMLVREGRV